MTIALGLMSGTSADGVSAALVSFKNRSFKLIACQTFSYPGSLRKKILKGAELKASEISQLNMRLGKIFAGAALKIMKRAKVSPKKISVIGSHGQTVYHGPGDSIPSTLQIGEAAAIAEQTGIAVVSDFRPRDMALGGEGAPLIPYFDSYFYGKGPVRALQNIGGIANVTLAGRDLKNPLAFDTGPGNCLVDLSMRKITKGKLSYDPKGSWAGRGRVQMDWISSVMRHPYFKRRPPKSTGRETFGEKFLEKYLGRLPAKRPYDVLATLTFFTALTIHEALIHFSPKPPEEIIVSGGGVKNVTLMRYLRELFSRVPVRSIEETGIPAQAKEPAAFAFFALRALHRRINHLPSATGASRPTILGKITWPGKPKTELPPGGRTLGRRSLKVRRRERGVPNETGG